MKYFESFPKIIKTDYNNNAILLTNILARVEIIPALLKNPLLFYNYDIQESDLPEIIGDKYYGDSYRYWLVLFANEILDPQAEWPLSNQQFNIYLNDKYSAAANANSSTVLSYTQSTVQQYTKTITTTDSISSETTSKTIIIDLPTFIATQTGTTTQTFPDGSSVTQTVSKTPISIYDYEIQQNESKRNIKLINKNYAADFEKQLASLLGR
jgi:hypothetical protein